MTGRIVREWRSENVQVVLYDAPAGLEMHRTRCQDDQFWLHLQGCWQDDGRHLRVADAVHYRPSTPCHRLSLTPSRSLGIRLFASAPLRSEERARQTPWQAALWQTAVRFADGGFDPNELDEVVIPLFSAPPRLPDTTAVRWLREARERIESMPDLTLVELARGANVSAAHLSTSFRRVYGVTLSHYRQQIRLRIALREAAKGGSLGNAALEGAFWDQSHFHRICQRETGLTPKVIRTALQRLLI